MNRIFHTILSSFIIALLAFTIVGCAKEEPVSQTKVRQPTDEELLADKLVDGQLLAVLYDDMPSEKGTNKMILYNAYDAPRSFKIEICENCHFDETQIQIPAEESKIIEFSVDPVPGEKTIVIRDSLDNYYTKQSFMVS